MRYRIGTEPDPSAITTDTRIFLVLAVFNILLGIGFILAGRYGRQGWLTVWGGMLTLASMGYVGAVLLGFR